jgi:hypothetical protein
MSSSAASICAYADTSVYSGLTGYAGSLTPKERAALDDLRRTVTTHDLKFKNEQEHVHIFLLR